MQWKIKKAAWLKSLQAISGIVSARALTPILSQVLLEFSKNQLKMYGADGYGQIYCCVPLADDDAPSYACCVQGKRLAEIVKNLADDNIIELQKIDNRLQISSGKSRFLLPTMDASQFPQFIKVESCVTFNFSALTLRTLLMQVDYAMATDDVRTFMNGLLWCYQEQKLELVATDGHRLAWTKMTQSDFPAENCSVLIPRRVIQEWLRLADLFGPQLELRIGEKGSVLIAEGYAYAAHHLDAVFPDYQQVIPKSTPHQLTLSKQQLRQALIRMRVLAQEKTQGVRFMIQDHILNISAQSMMQEQAEECIDLQDKASEWTVGFNAGYLLDVLAVHPDELLSFCWPDNHSLIIFRWQLSETLKTDCGCLIMPLTL